MTYHQALDDALRVYGVDKLLDPNDPLSTSDERCTIPYLMLLKEKTRPKPLLMTVKSFSRHKSSSTLKPAYSKISLNASTHSITSPSATGALSSTDVTTDIIIASAVHVEDDDDEEEEETKG